MKKILLFIEAKKNKYLYLNFPKNKEKWIYQRTEDNPKYLFLNHRRNEEKLMHLSSNPASTKQTNGVANKYGFLKNLFTG